MSIKNYSKENYNVLEYESTNIYIIENILDDKTCEDFIKLIDIIPVIKNSISYGNNVECYLNTIEDLLDINDEDLYYFNINTEEYNSILNKIKENNCIYTNLLNGLKKDKITEYQELLKNKLIIIKKIMKDINSELEFNQNSGFILRKIYGETRAHCDGLSQIVEPENLNFTFNFIRDNACGNYKYIRNSTMIFSLNDNYEDGILQFPYYNINIKLKKGSLIIFPPYWTHKHQTSSPKNNTFRYTITTWNCERLI